MNLEIEIAKSLLKINAVRLQPHDPFTWASGLRSPIYCDNRISLSYPEVRNQIKSAFVAHVQSLDSIDAISGVATAGISHGAILADALGLPFSYVRSKAKAHGKQNQIEGFIKPNSNILVVEDLISTGGSSLDAVQCLLDAGHRVHSVVAIFSYEFNIAIENFKNKKCKFHTLSNYSALLKESLNQNTIDQSTFDILKTWKNDPKKWSEYFLQSRLTK